MHNESAHWSNSGIPNIESVPQKDSPRDWAVVREEMLARLSDWVDTVGETEDGRQRIAEFLQLWDSAEADLALPSTIIDGDPSGHLLFGLSQLVGDLTALRHDLKSQAKNSRALVDQVAADAQRIIAASGRAVEQISLLQPTSDRELTRPLVIMVIEADEALLRLRDAFDHNAAKWSVLPETPVKTWFGGTAANRSHAAWERAWREQQALVSGLADGLRMTVDRLTGQLQARSIRRIGNVGDMFDPLTMQVLEVQPTDEFAPGIVLNVLRFGYRQNDWIIRPAQVVTASEHLASSK